MPPGPQRQSYRLPRRGFGWHGIHERAGLTDEVYSAGYLFSLKNYHLVGRGRVLKRKGSTRLIPLNVVDAKPVQQLAVFESGTINKLIALCNGKIYYFNTSEWVELTGSLTFADGATSRMRVAQFIEGTTDYIVGTAPGNNRLWKWTGTGNATTLTDAITTGPQYAKDIATFQGRLWALNTSNGKTILEWSDEGVATEWASGQYMHCSRETQGVALANHGKSTLLVFHEKSIHRINYDYSSTEPWVQQPITETMGTIAAGSVVHSKGVTYFATPEGIYRIKSPNSPPEYISYPIEETWGNLNRLRMEYLEGFERGEPWNEVVWLATSSASSYHDTALVWNTELEDWSVFSSPYANFRYNCGISYTNSDKKEVTLLGDYTGGVWVAWGDDNYDTGNLDGGTSGSVVDSEMQTGMLDFGYDGIKRLKEIWVDAVIPTTKNFTLEVIGLGEGTIIQSTGAVGTTGGRLSIDFILDQSRLAYSSTPTQARLKALARSRMFQFKLTEQDNSDPHQINSITAWWLPRGRRFNT